MRPRHKAGCSHRASSKTAARPNRDAVIGASACSQPGLEPQRACTGAFVTFCSVSAAHNDRSQPGRRHGEKSEMSVADNSLNSHFSRFHRNANARLVRRRSAGTRVARDHTS